MTITKTTALLVTYALGVFLTFGHVFNANYIEPTPKIDCGERPTSIDVNWNAYWDCLRANIDAEYSGTTRFQAGFPAAYAAIVWPIYWGGTIAIKVTK